MHFPGGFILNYPSLLSTGVLDGLQKCTFQLICTQKEFSWFTLTVLHDVNYSMVTMENWEIHFRSALLIHTKKLM